MEPNLFEKLHPILRAMNELLELTGKDDEKMNDFDVLLKERIEDTRKYTADLMAEYLDENYELLKNAVK